MQAHSQVLHTAASSPRPGKSVVPGIAIASIAGLSSIRPGRSGPGHDAGSATRQEVHAMLNGVVVDDLTGHFLRIATDVGWCRDLSKTLRVFLHDARNHLNSIKIGLYLARRGATTGHGI